MAAKTSIGKSFSFPTRLLSQSGSGLRGSKIDALGLTVGEITWPSACEETRNKNLGHVVLARSARTPVRSAMSALNASAQCGQDDMRGFAGRARIETHHAAKHSALELLAATRCLTAFTNGCQASGTRVAYPYRGLLQVANGKRAAFPIYAAPCAALCIRPCQLPYASTQHLARLL